MTTIREAVWRNLPSVYRRAGSLTPAYGLATVLGRMLVDVERSAQDVVRAHYLNDAADLDDLTRLAAWFQLDPWPEEDRDAFRARIRRMVSIYREGAANAARMLELLAVAMGGEVALMNSKPAIFVPRLTSAEAEASPKQATHSPWPESGTDWAGLVPTKPNPFAVYAILAVVRDKVTWGVPAALLDMPLEHHSREWKPDAKMGWCEWRVDPPYQVMGDDSQLDECGDPTVILRAPPTQPVSLPALVQRDLQRVVLVNRKIPAGGALQVKLDDFTLQDLVPLKPSVKVLADRPDLLFGAGSLLGETPRGRAPWPFHLLRWYTREQIRPLDPGERPDDHWAKKPLPDVLPWPHLLTPLAPGREPTAWRLLLGTKDLTLVQPAKTTTVESVRFEMDGRRPGTFTLVYDQGWVLGADTANPREHRLTWLEEQVRRLKLAGVLYLRQDQVNEHLELPAAAPLGAVSPKVG